MTREEYLQKMQSFREDLQAAAKKQREDLDQLNDGYRQKLAELNEWKRTEERRLRDSHTEYQHDIERQMHNLKVEWAKEHPVCEVKVME